MSNKKKTVECIKISFSVSLKVMIILPDIIKHIQSFRN